MNRYFKIILSFLFIVLLQSCATTSKKPQSVHGDKPLIDTAKIIIEGTKDMDKKEKLKVLRKEYSRWNALTNNSDKSIRERAREMRDLAANIRKQYN